MKFSWLIIIVTFLYSKSMIAYENNEFPMIMYAVPGVIQILKKLSH